MREPTQREMETILTALRSAKDIVGCITGRPYEDVVDSERYLSDLFYILNDACINLSAMMEKKG